MCSSDLKPSDDPAGAQQLAELDRRDADAAVYGTNLTLASSLLDQADGVLKQITAQLTRATELATQAATGTQTDAARKSIARGSGEADAISFDLEDAEYTDLKPQLLRSLAFAYAWADQLTKMRGVLKQLEKLNAQILMGFITKKKDDAVYAFTEDQAKELGSVMLKFLEYALDGKLTNSPVKNK